MNSVLVNGVEVVPSKIVCVGRNYVAHIHELGNEVPQSMVLFMKPNSAITSQLQTFEEPVRFEAEICFMVRNGTLSAVGVGLDLTKVTTQNYLKSKGLPWEKAKAFKGAALFSEFVSLEGVALEALQMQLHIDETLVQHANMALMIHKPESILQQSDAHFHLEDGDIIMSGTPKGVRTYAAGEHFVLTLLHENSVLTRVSWVVDA